MIALLLLACVHHTARPEPVAIYHCWIAGAGEHRGHRCWWDVCSEETHAPDSSGPLWWVSMWDGGWEACDPSQGEVCAAELERAREWCSWEER